MSDPTIIIWSNNSQGRAWSTPNSEPVEYKYYDEKPVIDINDEMRSNVIYQGTKFHNNNIKCLNNNNERGLYIFKDKDYWKCVGIIEKAEYIGDYNWNFTILKTEDSKILSTNKSDSLTILNLEKKKGKGTGNINWGFCRVKPI